MGPNLILDIFNNVQFFLSYAGYVAPFILLLILLVVVPQLWLAYVRAYYLKSQKYILLELRPPREVRKTPKAMEQVFTAIYALRSGPTLAVLGARLNEKWWNGEIMLHYGAEIVSFGGETHFYMWIPEKHRNIIEAALYSHYPDLDIKEAEDYIDRVPKTFAELKERGYEVFGTEFYLGAKREIAKQKGNWDVVPIRTFFDFEAVAEEKELDPISGVMEVMGKIRPQDTLWLQILFQPLDSDEKEPDALLKEGAVKIGELKARARSVKNELTGEIHMVMPSPGETELMRAIERKLSKPVFKTVLRTVYIGPKEGFSANFGQRGLISALNQYGSEAYNTFKNNPFVWTRANIWYSPYIFPARRGLARKERIMKYYRARKIYTDSAIARLLQFQIAEFGSSGFTSHLNTEELGTLFHLPTVLVLTAPTFQTEGARKVGPPAGLPIYGEKEHNLPGIE
ncbi:MAG: hypothetical protein Q8R40_00065 [bacterium]|nr:hypothetical protein [bacterium]